jgi:hypothetical protein
MDNRSGNKTQANSSRSILSTILLELHTSYNNCIANNINSGIETDSASAGWVLQMAHQTTIYEDPNHKRVIFCDNFYT